MEEDEGLEWESNEVEENGGNRTWILNKGWAVGKKMLITGVVISSAPVILPPLMIISTLGLVCAVPVGFFLASYACAEKLVITLVPTHKAPPVTNEGLGATDDDKEFGGDADMANEGEELRRRADMKLEQDGKETYEGEVNSKGETIEKNGFTEEDEKPTEDMPGVMIVIEEEDENGDVKEEVTVDVTDVAVVLCERDDSELVKETTGLLEKFRDEGLSSEHEGTDRNVEQTVTQSRKVDTAKMNETEANHGKKKKVEEIGIDLVDEEQKGALDSATPAGNKKDIGFLEVTVPSNATSPESGGVTSKEALDSEDKIWEQIDAMRAIVGYTAARHTTCIEELKALYVFTGIEPPALFNHPSDLAVINGKLKFLMSIVGVK